MRYITFSEIFLWSLLISFVFALIAQTLWILIHKEQKKPNFIRLLLGMCVTAGGSSIVLAILVMYLLPSVYIVGTNDYDSKMFISSEWSTQLSKIYIDNRSGEDLFLVAVSYGSADEVDEFINIPAGDFKECNHSIQGYDERIPQTIYSEGSGEVHWYLFSSSYIENNKYGFFY